jgi:hypothetical protein
MKNYSVVLVMCVFLISCKKEDTTFNALDFLDSKQVVAQTFTVQAGQPVNITGAKGFNLIHDGVFLNNLGQPVTGDVTIKLKEVTTNSEAIYSRLLTQMESDTILKSAGMFSLAFYQGNNSVFPQNPSQVIVPSVGAPDTTMRLYNQGAYDFQPGDTNRYSTGAWGNNEDACSSISFSANSYNVIYCHNSNLQWINLDVPIYRPPSIEIYADINKFLDESLAYLIFDNYNSVSQMRPYMNADKYSQSNVPEGEPITIIVLGNKDDEVFFGKYSGIATSDMIANISMNTISQEDLEAELSAID